MAFLFSDAHFRPKDDRLSNLLPTAHPTTLWNGDTIQIDPATDFTALLRESLELEQVGIHQCLSLSPLTSLESSPELLPAQPQQPKAIDDSLSLPTPLVDSKPIAGPSGAKIQASSAAANPSHPKKQSRAARKRKRQQEKDVGPLGSYALRQGVQKALKKHTQDPRPLRTSFDSTKLSIANTGFLGRREKKSTTVYHLGQLVGENSRFKLRLVEWDGLTPTPLTDGSGRVVGVLVGQPADAGWGGVQRSAAQALEEARGQLSFQKADKKHRRGRFPALAVGISHGGGQVRPAVLDHDRKNDNILRGLLNCPAFIRIAGFGSSSFANWAPRLYEYYVKHLQPLLASDDRLFCNFANSIFCCATLNFGPMTACFKHKDHNNLAFGWCAITALGSFDPKKGGHLILWDLKLVVEFPPGATVLIPSSTIAHSNTPVGLAEARYSFTQYTAGGIFRWVQRGFQKDESFFEGFSKKERADILAGMDEQLMEGLSLLSNIKEFCPSK